MQEYEIVLKALSAFRKQTGASLAVVPLGDLSKQKKFVLDTRVRLKIGKEVAEFKVEVKNELRQLHLPILLDRLKDKEEDWLIISQYIPKPLKEDMKRHGINYLEASGNCFIRYRNWFFYINDQAVTPSRLPEEGKLWKSTGLKFLFLLLQKPGMINESYRTLAKATKVALGNIGPFLDELKKEGYVNEYNQGQLFFENQQQLQRKWVELFASVLRPKLRLGNFRFLDEGRYSDWSRIPAHHFFWGGEAAGALLTDYLRPERFTLYTSYPKTDLMKELKMVPDENGRIELMEIFWNEYEVESSLPPSRTVPPLLAYAELATSLDSRNRETAERIKENYLENRSGSTTNYH
jgi:hypothetical protein